MTIILLYWCIFHRFFFKWLDDEEDDLHDVVAVRNIKVPEDTDILDLIPGDQCQACFDNKFYTVEVVANGVL